MSRGPALADREVLFESGDPADAVATVCITHYDYEAYLPDALESAWAQTLPELGLVVLDDASPDDGGVRRAERWLRVWAGRFATTRLARHRRNQGLAGARNSAFGLAESAYLMVLDADNQLYPRCVERLLEALAASDHAFAYPIIEDFDGREGLKGCAAWSVELLRRENYIDAMALVRRSAWEAVGGYSRMEVGGWEDYDFWCKCVDAGLSGLLVPEILARYRLHPRSMLRTETDLARNRRRVWREMRARHPWLQGPAR